MLIDESILLVIEIIFASKQIFTHKLISSLFACVNFPFLNDDLSLLLKME